MIHSKGDGKMKPEEALFYGEECEFHEAYG